MGTTITILKRPKVVAPELHLSEASKHPLVELNEVGPADPIDINSASLSNPAAPPVESHLSRTEIRKQRRKRAREIKKESRHPLTTRYLDAMKNTPHLSPRKVNGMYEIMPKSIAFVLGRMINAKSAMSPPEFSEPSSEEEIDNNRLSLKFEIPETLKGKIVSRDDPVLGPDATVKRIGVGEARKKEFPQRVDPLWT